jgi:hypothetical protein
MEARVFWGLAWLEISNVERLEVAAGYLRVSIRSGYSLSKRQSSWGLVLGALEINGVRCGPDILCYVV